jgi:hypothetical protein
MESKIINGEITCLVTTNTSQWMTLTAIRWRPKP